MPFRRNKTLTLFICAQFFSVTLLGQTQLQRPVYGSQTYPRSGERYITDEFGVARMWVNVWGHVNKPGSHLVYDGIDLATLLSITGGPKPGANLRKVRLFRDVPDKSDRLTYIIDMEKFLKTGDRSGFIEVLPNDTYVIPQKLTSFVLSQAGLLNTFLSIINIYLQIQIYSKR